eukprot:6459100-Alexandrium_andersonii.AAC.1
MPGDEFVVTHAVFFHSVIYVGWVGLFRSQLRGALCAHRQGLREALRRNPPVRSQSISGPSSARHPVEAVT